MEQLAARIVRRIKELAQGLDEIKIMGFCGTHEYTISCHGLRSLMPPNVELIAGPGCPVCVVPAAYIDACIRLAMDGVRVLTYGDMYRVPGSRLSLAQARAEGADVRVVYSFLDAIKIAKDGKESVFFGVGFETTQPSVAAPLVQGRVPPNLKILSAYRLTPPIMRHVLSLGDIRISGVIAPGHVSTIIGASAWRFVASDFGIPVVVAGFEPIDVLLAILEILRQLREGRAALFNEYTRAVGEEGNRRAWELVMRVFEVEDARWRGIGRVPQSGLRLKDAYRIYDAVEEYGLKIESGRDVVPGCKCADVILGRAKPTDCPHFMKTCKPSSPLGPCMVSSEGTCAIWARFGGWRRVHGT